MNCIPLILVFALFFITALAEGPVVKTEKVVRKCTNRAHHPLAVTSSVKLANKYLSDHEFTAPLEDRLAVMVLYSHGFDDPDGPKSRLKYLKCALKSLKKHVAHLTPLDIYLWVPAGSMAAAAAWLKNPELPLVFPMPIPEVTWQVPCGLKDDSLWAKRYDFEYDYYLMGRWRLAFSFDFVRKMGYKYKLQFDDDTYVVNPLKWNLVEEMKSRDYQMTTIQGMMHEDPELLDGLAELTKTWIDSHNYTVLGNLRMNVVGFDIANLNTLNWHRNYHPGYFIITSVDLYFHPLVKDFISTVFRSGKDIEGRWQEQGVLNMMLLVFIPVEKHWKIDEMDMNAREAHHSPDAFMRMEAERIHIGHDRHHPENFRSMCENKGLA